MIWPRIKAADKTPLQRPDAEPAVGIVNRPRWPDLVHLRIVDERREIIEDELAADAITKRAEARGEQQGDVPARRSGGLRHGFQLSCSWKMPQSRPQSRHNWQEALVGAGDSLRARGK